ncbi:MAG: ABA4-like family protein [Planctomycetota bacterium]|nr:ABA4-like family protein [Planctomycetota bacterium]
MMDWGQAFQIANSVALVAWISLIFLPRASWLIFALRRGLVGSICLIYTAVIFRFISEVDGGGFSTLNEVKALFGSDAVVFAGWLHYLAFDLFVGLWIAEQSDLKKIHRVFQAPILAATFLLGPFGLLLYFALDSGLAFVRRGVSDQTPTESH